MAVTPCSSSQLTRRPSSVRTIAASPRALNSTSIVSSRTRFARVRWIISPRIRKSGSSVNSPVETYSVAPTWKERTLISPLSLEPVEVEAERADVGDDFGF